MANFEEHSNYEEVEINYKKLLIKTLLSILGFVSIFILLNLIFKESLYTFSHKFVELLGGYAIAFGFFVTAAFLIPWPDDALSAFGLLGGMDFFIVVGIASISSLLGGIVGYYLGKSLKNTRLYIRLMKRYRKQAEYLINKHGGKALAIAALTPLPDSPFCWICGALGLPFKTFFWTLFICRTIKITYVLLLIKIGVLSF